MSEPCVGVYSIGQTPRPDLTDALGGRWGAVRFTIRGALDGVDPASLPLGEGHAYPLETRLADGNRVVLGARYLESRVQALIDELDAEVVAHLVLCAGPFPELRAARPLIVPFEVGCGVLLERGVRSLELLVPFEAQAGPAEAKWRERGFECRVHVPTRAASDAVAVWLADRIDPSAEAVVFDYVGFPRDVLQQVRERVGLPVFDLGELALDELERFLNAERSDT